MVDVLKTVRNAANNEIKATQNKVMRLYTMESYVDIVQDLVDHIGKCVLTIDANYGRKSFYITYMLKENEGLRSERVAGILNWCLDNIQYDQLTETNTTYDRTWVFTCDNDSYQIHISMDHSNSTQCNLVETGEYTTTAIKKLVCS